MFVDAPNGNFRIDPCSPAVNTGDNVATDTLGLLTDLEGHLRIFADSVDMGAFEVQDTCAIVTAHEPAAMGLLELSPNPSPGILQVVLPGLPVDETVTFSISDMHGRELYSQKSTLSGIVELHLEQLPGGVYQIRVQTKNKVWIGKWIKT